MELINKRWDEHVGKRIIYKEIPALSYCEPDGIKHIEADLLEIREGMLRLRDSRGFVYWVRESAVSLFAWKETTNA